MSDRAERLAFWRRWHSHVLGRKGLIDDTALWAAIDHDRVVALAAARMLLTGVPTRSLLGEFFADRADIHGEVVAVAEEEFVNHIGFQVREPLDIWLEGLTHWAPRFDFDVIGAKRFTASEAFREQVAAFAEIMQIWLCHDGSTVELELFDIHRPNPVGSGRLGHLHGDDGSRALLAAATPEVLRSVLADDDIWHFGVLIMSEAAVERLHDRFLALVRDDARFCLRTERTVANSWHGSVHTKLTNLELDTEVEFLTYQVDWQARELR